MPVTAKTTDMNVERLLRQMVRPADPLSVSDTSAGDTDALAEPAKVPWKLVAADGSTSVCRVGCDRPNGSAKRDEPEDIFREPAAPLRQDTPTRPGAVVILHEDPEADDRPTTGSDPFSGAIPSTASDDRIGDTPHSTPPPPSGQQWDIDFQLARVIDGWNELPRTVQAGILAMIEAVKKDG